MEQKQEVTTPNNALPGSIDVSIILPMYNAEKWLDECLASVSKQEFVGNLELSVYNDGSKDRSQDILDSWIPKLGKIQVTLGTGLAGHPRGVGYAKNRAIEQSRGTYLCFLDSDDVMHKDRIQAQYDAALAHPNALIGCQFYREPEGSTERYTRWANALSQQQLYTQIYTSHGPTLIMPTWFCSRETFNRVGKFDESGKGTPEDLIFFFHHLQQGGALHRVDLDHPLLMYRYHPEAATFSVQEDTIWEIRVKEIQDRVISKWESFTIWNAGKQGRHFFRSLTETNRKKVAAFCDVDAKKISKGFYTYEETEERPKPKIPIVHFTKARPPFVICVKQNLTGGGFESNLSSLNLADGVDYFHFN